ncbi:dTDP-4-dehydrorhamnose 3,5-epimerase [Muriicola sp. Z0-33]|uniref:dTDP-4-dehydrorhamnose 3,5-epimerase n=1 Tax=Muriicola sp. Z0-33 TaxID=2816957 RepID=UPI00223795D4|nr:dTDP-4-dehydrorhamnose 3,5-epimerase [Muriicola sp. Z0-33]MCW5514652.1 dTDP-4-dehydrorhamnose 3,5-epimerase [Muriicola sp. Z0-33]
MTISKNNIAGSFVINPDIYEDERGTFFESFNQKEFEKILGNPIQFVQDNHSISNKGVLRGLHFQKGKHAQSKLVRVVRGEVIDVIVDIRKDSPSFGEQFKLRLSEKNKKTLFIPKGVAHGFLALEEETVFVYKCDEYYNKEAESGIIYNDPQWNIDWEFPADQIILSKKDSLLPPFNELEL